VAAGHRHDFFFSKTGFFTKEIICVFLKVA